MQVGTEIILQRMKEFPEEFVHDGELFGKWERSMMGYRDILPKEDVEAIDAGYRQLRIDKFNETVLKTLAGDFPPLVTKYKTAERYTQGATDPRGVFGNAPIKGGGTVVNYDPAWNAAQQSAEWK